MIKSLAHQRN